MIDRAVRKKEKPKARFSSPIFQWTLAKRLKGEASTAYSRASLFYSMKKYVVAAPASLRFHAKFQHPEKVSDRKS
jgi:hypothetical protein